MNLGSGELLLRTRRHFFRDCGMGVGKIALAGLLADRGVFASTPGADAPGSPARTHFPAKVKHVIYLFMAGAPSQLELFEHKPKINELNGKPIPESFLKEKRFAFMDTFTK